MFLVGASVAAAAATLAPTKNKEAAATKAVARLERKGLVKRTENVIDRRIVDVTLTSRATNAMR